ncbi:hypothetical protein PPECC33_p3167 (plasmid) [Escherichia coli PCN033]|nr:hypothetical protein PPECC33_p3167 [Escherichia coli PCN033]
MYVAYSNRISYLWLRSIVQNGQNAAVSPQACGETFCL